MRAAFGRALAGEVVRREQHLLSRLRLTAREVYGQEDVEEGELGPPADPGAEPGFHKP